MLRSTRFVLPLSIVVLAGMAIGSEAQERTAAVVPERPARVFVMAGFDDACKSLAPVEITITMPPSQGVVSLRPGQETTIVSSASGKCTGTRVAGTGIYYTARANASGADTFTVSARVGAAAPVTRTFAVRIAAD